MCDVCSLCVPAAAAAVHTWNSEIHSRCSPCAAAVRSRRQSRGRRHCRRGCRREGCLRSASTHGAWQEAVTTTQCERRRRPWRVPSEHRRGRPARTTGKCQAILPCAAAERPSLRVRMPRPLQRALCATAADAFAVSRAASQVFPHLRQPCRPLAKTFRATRVRGTPARDAILAIA